MCDGWCEHQDKYLFFLCLVIRQPHSSTRAISSAASEEYKRQPLPEEQEDFFDETNGEPSLLNENSRLNPDDLKDTKVDSLGVPIKKVDSLIKDKKKILEKKKKSGKGTTKI